MTKAGTSTTTKASAPKTDAAPAVPEGEGTKLVQINDPAKLTEAKIKDITADDGTETAENTANADAAEALREVKVASKKGDQPERGYFHGQGGAAGL